MSRRSRIPATRLTRRALAGVAIATTMLLSLAAPVHVAAATGWAVFGTPTASASLTAGVTFTQPVEVDRELERVELLLAFGDAPGRTVILAPFPAGSGAMTLTYTLDPVADGHLLPNTPLSARWRLVGTDDPANVEVGPSRGHGADDRFDGEPRRVSRPRALARGQRRVWRARPRDRRTRSEASELLRSPRRPGRLLRLCGPGCVLRRPGPRDA
jgi:hypothetical protein